MVTMGNTTIPREDIWRAFRQTHAVRLRERSHGMLRLIDGNSGPEVAPWRSREEDTMRSGVHAFNQGGQRD
jgi:hypothetical protein